MLITGAHSFIGNAVRARLEGDPAVEAGMAGVRDGAWREIDFSRYDCVLHAAGIAHVRADGSLDAQYDAVNHRLTADLAARAKASGVGQFIFLSSIIVFGEASPAGVRWEIGPETAPAPANAYGQSKLDAENALRGLAGDGFRVAILRLPMVYGRGCKGNYNALVRLAQRLPVFPEFDNRRSALYVGNLAELVRRAALDGAEGTFHPRDGRPQSTSSIVRAVCSAHGRRMRFSRALAPLVRWTGGHGLVRRAFGDMAYADAAPDYPGDYRRFSFEEGIRETETGAP